MTSVAIIKSCKELTSVLANLVDRTGEFYIAGLYYSCEDALEGLLQNPVDIAIIDIQIDNCRGTELIATLSRQTLHTKFLVCTIQNDEETIFNALRAGADGYILMDTHFEKIKEALQELIIGGAPMSSLVASKVLRYFHPRKQINNTPVLSHREKEILHFMSRGLLYKEIAFQLGIQRETVKKHLSKIYGKLQVQNKVEALNKIYGF